VSSVASALNNKYKTVKGGKSNLKLYHVPGAVRDQPFSCPQKSAKKVNTRLPCHFRYFIERCAPLLARPLIAYPCQTHAAHKFSAAGQSSDWRWSWSYKAACAPGVPSISVINGWPRSTT